MKTIYIYTKNSGSDFFLSIRLLNFSETICPNTEESSKLISICYTEEELVEKVKYFISKGLNPIICDLYQDIATKYELPVNISEQLC